MKGPWRKLAEDMLLMAIACAAAIGVGYGIYLLLSWLRFIFGGEK
jgi:hypothetical protein